MQQHYIFIDSIDPYRGHVVSLDPQGQVVENRADVVLSTLNKRSELSRDDTNTRVHLILSDHLVSAYELNIKAKNRQQLEKAASFAIEEMLPSELDEYHIVTEKNTLGGASVRCIPNTRILQLLENCKQLGFDTYSIVTESDLLDAKQSSLLIKHNDSCLKTPANQEVLDLDNDVLPLLGERLFSLLKDVNELDLIFSAEHKMLAETITSQASDNIRVRQIPRDQDYFSKLAFANKGKHAIIGCFQASWLLLVGF